MKIDLMGLHFNTESKAEILNLIAGRLDKGKTFIVTPSSEFYWYVSKDNELKRIINSADISLPDGISIVWLSYFLNFPLTFKNYYAKILQALAQMACSLASILVYPPRIKVVLKEKIPGSVFFWDLIKIASEKKMSVFLLGGFGDTPEIVGREIKKRYPQVKIAGTFNGSPGDPHTLKEINDSGAELLFVAYGPGRQEKWIHANLQELCVKVAVGIGGTFDYIAGRKKSPPEFMRSAGLEWLYRLVTQPERFRRIWHATFDFLRGALRYKVFMTLPFRENVCGVIINQEKKVLLVGQKIQIGSFDQRREIINWHFPQGGIDPGESPEKALFREMQEETGLARLKIVREVPGTFKYIWPHYIRPLFSNVRRYKGQEQRVYILQPEGDIKINLQNELSEFFFKWADRNELLASYDRIRKEQLNFILPEIDKFIWPRQTK